MRGSNIGADSLAVFQGVKENYIARSNELVLLMLTVFGGRVRWAEMMVQGCFVLGVAVSGIISQRNSRTSSSEGGMRLLC